MYQKLGLQCLFILLSELSPYNTLALPLTANIILSSVSSDKQTDASGIMSTSSSLGTSMGTALIGVVLILCNHQWFVWCIRSNLP